MFGPLVTHSAFAFEGQMGTFVRSSHATRGIVHQVNTHIVNYQLHCGASMCIEFYILTDFSAFDATLFTQPRAEGPRLCNSRRDRTEVYN